MVIGNVTWTFKNGETRNGGFAARALVTGADTEEPRLKLYQGWAVHLQRTPEIRRETNICAKGPFRIDGGTRTTIREYGRLSASGDVKMDNPFRSQLKAVKVLRSASKYCIRPQ
jgi:hypothetical protein